MLNVFKNKSIKADPFGAGYYISKTKTKAGVVECIAQQVPRLFNGCHWRFNFKLDSKVISAKKLEKLLNE